MLWIEGGERNNAYGWALPTDILIEIDKWASHYV